MKQLKKNIALVTVNLRTRQILDVHLNERNLRFKCKRCAIYCCKLGGPNLTKKDIEQIESAGHNISEFTEPAKRQYANFSPMPSAVKSKKDGSCVFLNIDKETNAYECSIYEVRPTLCRLYPFDFERINANSFLLKVIPCCKGLANVDGELVSEGFIKECLFESILRLTNEI